MLEKRNGRIGLRGEGPLHVLETIETDLGPRLSQCTLCGDPGRNWDKPCPANVVPPLDRCEWEGREGTCKTEGAVLLDDHRWLCHQHALAAEEHEGNDGGDVT